MYHCTICNSARKPSWNPTKLGFVFRTYGLRHFTEAVLIVSVINMELIVLFHSVLNLHSQQIRVENEILFMIVQKGTEHICSLHFFFSCEFFKMSF